MIYETNIKNNHNTELLDAAQSISLKKNASPNFRYIVNRLFGHMSSETYTEMEYDLSEHGRIIDTDSLVASAFKKKRQGICKAGVELVSDNPRNLEYVQKRIAEMEYVTSLSFEMLVEEISENLVNYNNCFLVKYRTERSSTGRVRELPSGSEIKPLAGVYVLSAPTIDTATDKQGNISKYRHRISEYYTRIYKKSDIIHMYHNKRSGITIGTPPLEAVKDDLYTLRNIEQCAETMIYRNASPFIHVKVGEKDSPARTLADGSSEVDVYSAIIDNMFEYGGVATPHRVNIDLKGSESQALRLESYLTHFQQRVLAGLQCSSVDLGIGTNTPGGSAGIISQGLKDDIRAYQKTISNFVTNQILNEILLESNYYIGKLTIPKKEQVRLEFSENDIDLRIKLETHYLNMFQGGLITQEFAMNHITDMTKKDIQPKPPEIKPNNVIGKNSNVLKSNSSAGRQIKDSVKFPENFPILQFISKQADLELLDSYIKTEMLLFEIKYDILDTIYEQTSSIKKTLGESYARVILLDSLLDLAIDNFTYYETKEE